MSQGRRESVSEGGEKVSWTRIEGSGTTREESLLVWGEDGERCQGRERKFKLKRGGSHGMCCHHVPMLKVHDVFHLMAWINKAHNYLCVPPSPPPHSCHTPPPSSRFYSHKISINYSSIVIFYQKDNITGVMGLPRRGDSSLHFVS